MDQAAVSIVFSLSRGRHGRLFGPYGGFEKPYGSMRKPTLNGRFCHHTLPNAFVFVENEGRTSQNSRQ